MSTLTFTAMYFRYVVCAAECSRGNSFNVDRRVFLLHRALMTSCRPARFFVAGPSFVSAVETLRRKIERSNVATPARMGSAFPSRIKYHNAPGTSIGIRCNQFGRSPKAVACKSSLQGISAGDTGGNQTLLRGQWSDSYTSIPYELDFQRTCRRCKFGKAFRNVVLFQATRVYVEVFLH